MSAICGRACRALAIGVIAAVILLLLTPDVALAHGVSITDACLGWDETAALLSELAESIVTRPA